MRDYCKTILPFRKHLSQIQIIPRNRSIVLLNPSPKLTTNRLPFQAIQLTHSMIFLNPKVLPQSIFITSPFFRKIKFLSFFVQNN